MIALKKLYGDELLRLALVLSLLKVDPNDYLEQETQQILAGLHTSNSSDWSLEQESRTLIRPRFVHPKSLDNILINYERELFEELNSLGRYTEQNNARIWYNQGPRLHTYLVNNVVTDTVAPALVAGPVADGQPDEVSADDNVAEEVKITDEESQDLKPDDIPQPDAVVTLSADFFSNRSESDVFEEIATRSFDVNELLVQPDDMQIKKEPDSDLDVKIKVENDDLYSDNAMDDYVSYFADKSEKFNMDESSSVFQQNLADLQEYEDIFDDVEDLKKDLELDIKQEQKDLEQYLMENTPLDSEVYELAPMFEEEVVLEVKRERASTSFTSASSSGVSDADSASLEASDVKFEVEEDQHSGDELTPEDVDIIKVLWKQDVDMGFSLEDPVVQPEGPQATKVCMREDLDKELQLAEENIVKEREGDINNVKKSLLDEKEEDPWAGLSYTVDTETGEYILQGELPGDLVSAEDSRFDLLEEALQLVELTDDADASNEPERPVEGSGDDMLHPAMRHVPHHPLAHYHNQSLMRSMSVEQRWQDLASLLTIPPPPEQYQHYHHHHNISHGAAAGYTPNYHHAPLPPAPEKHPDTYGAAAALEVPYKVETTHPQQHDALYYQNTTTEMPPAPPAQDGLLQSILNDEDLQLMDMAMNDGMYTMRMLDGGSVHHPPPHNHTHVMMTERDSASDSAVSSMGSERVPSLSDSEWCDGGDSAHEFHSSKFRPYESYGRDRAITHPPQKKHHMFGKRCFQEQPPPIRPAVKYEPPSCHEQAYHHDANIHIQNDYIPRPLAPSHVMQPALDLNTPHSSHTVLPTPVNCERFGFSDRVRHNHTYSAPPATPPSRDKRVRRLTDGSASDTSAGHSLSRDEKRAKALGKCGHGIPIEVHDIINLPMDEFNERLSKHDLSEAQLSLIRDIRRRGKNKVAAQNCRKRKLDQISSLADEVRTVRERKQRTQRDHHNLLMTRQRLKERFRHLYTHVFQSLRDEAGRPLQSSQYSLQQAADGNVVLVPKMPPLNDHGMNRPDDDMERKADNYDQ